MGQIILFVLVCVSECVHIGLRVGECGLASVCVFICSCVLSCESGCGCGRYVCVCAVEKWLPGVPCCILVDKGPLSVPRSDFENNTLAFSPIEKTQGLKLARKRVLSNKISSKNAFLIYYLSALASS